MKTSSVMPATESHEQWVPLLAVAAREVFELMLGCHLTVHTPSSGEPLNITAMVGLAGQLCGVMRICCSSRKSATIMASKMLSVEEDKIGSELADAMGESATWSPAISRTRLPA